jgi:hypothetical protein
MSENRELTLRNTSRARARDTGRWRAKFLRALREVPSIKHACMVAKIDRATVYRHREQDEQFAEQWRDAIQASVDELEHKAFQMALDGDPSLVTFMLRSHKPEVYGDRSRVDVGLLGGIVLIPEKGQGEE